MSPDEALAIRGAIAGIHVHIGSQLLSITGARQTIAWLNRFLAEADWKPEAVDLGGGLGVPTHPEERAPTITEFVTTVTGGLETRARLILEPGRSLVGHAGVTLYRAGVVKSSGHRRWVAVDGGLSDNPRPQLYGARYTAVIANRAETAGTQTFGIAGKHCESGDVLIEAVDLADPRPGDLIAVPATGAYTLGMGSNYNAVPRPAAVLVSDGEARLIRRRETVDDLLALDVT
jgi:diaminopimelate decarboxylase